jgi:hypothetical protein
MKISRKIIAGAALTIALAGSATAWANAGSPNPQPNSRSSAQLSPQAAGAPARYMTLTPCRIVDTRKVGGPIAAGGIRAFQVAGGIDKEQDFVQQGGRSCGVPAEATAVQAILIAVNAAGPGDLRAWPYGTVEPLASVLGYTNLFNASTGTALAFSGDSSWASDVLVKAGGQSTQVVIDVVGFYLA